LSTREPGSVLDGKYEIVQRLGSGGMGEVYQVRHLHLQELRVVKILRQDLATDPSAQKRFMREARLATQIKHPNVAILYDFASLPDGSFYMVWEHIEGQDVGDRLRQQGPFPVPVAIQLGIQALRGLEAIHSAGIIHRDISPDNLMIAQDRRGQSQIKIIDLGLAKTLEREADPNLEITQVGMFMGKLRYCSPEQARAVNGETPDRRSDLYSFALVLYEMITGLPPFESENQHGFIFKRLSEDPLPLAGRNPQVEVPRQLDRIVRKALERERDNRYPDAVSFIQDLDNAARGLNAAQTQEIPLPALAAPRPAPVASAPRPRSSSELSREERLELLAQIERAGKRTQESAGDVAKVEAALAAGRLDEAQTLIGRIEATNPRASGLTRLKERLAEAQGADVKRRVAEAEQVLAGYIQKKQLQLARLALDTLLELEPGHPRKAEYRNAVDGIGREKEHEKRFDAALAAGREAIARRDFKTANRELEALLKSDPTGERAGAFHVELEAAERAARRESELDGHLRRLETLIAERKVEEAEKELGQLAGLEVTRLTLDLYRERLDGVRSRIEQERHEVTYEGRYRKAVQARDWFTAREVAVELERAAPASPRAAAMFAEVERLDAEDRRRKSIEQGVRQVETFLGQRDLAKAELALKILLQMDPGNPHRQRLERQVQALRG
jgi:serine/threonine protein kinase